MKISITSLPYGIGPLYVPPQVRTPEAEAEWVAEAMKTARQVTTVMDIPVYAIRRNNAPTFFVLSKTEKGLDYIVEFNNVKLKGDLPRELRSRATFQSSVWRSAAMALRARGFPAQMFWKYLISPNRTVISDSAQSTNGEYFWYERISEALDRGHKVHVLDCELSGGILSIESASPFTDIDDFKKYYTYEANQDGYYKRFSISL